MVFCAHCGLPVPGTPKESLAPSVADQAEPEYCCFGCQIAAEAGREAGDEGELGKTVLRLGLSIFLSLNVMIFTMWLWTHDVYGPTGERDTRAADVLWNLCRYATLVLSLPVLWMLGLPLAQGAWRSFRRGVPTTDLLLIAGTAAAYSYSIVSTLRGSGPVYFEVGCAVLVLVTLGRWLEARGKRQATAALESMERLLPDDVRRYERGETRQIPLDDVRVGDRLRVFAGERIPVDGRIVRGAASVDSQMLTGESRPAVREVGDAVIGGTLNLDGDLTIEATAEPRGGAWRRLLDCLREARQTKGRYQLLADRTAAWFLPVVAVVAGGTLIYHATTAGLDQGLLAALAVVLVACPCALGLATPLAVWAALGTAAKHQVLFRHGEALERLARVRAVVFDKTGTLTDGRPSVEHFETAPGNSVCEAAGIAAALVAGSAHDLSRAVAAYLRERIIGSIPEAVVRTLAGRGVEGRFAEGLVAYLGSERLMREQRLQFPTALLAAADRYAGAGLPLACLGWNGRVRGLFAFREQFRPEAVDAVRAAEAAGLTVQVFTGDHARRGMETARKLGVVVRAELLPEDKVSAVGELRRTVGPTLMVGDGINDAPALAAADVGMALGCGADVSRQTADVCLQGNDLGRVAWSIELAERTVTVIRQNLFWSFAYNAVGIGLAATGRLNPVWAAVAMAAGGISVVANSLRLARLNPPEAAAPATVAAPKSEAVRPQPVPESAP